MKFIKKQGAPELYISWCHTQRGKENEDYRCVPSEEKDELLNALIKEQGGICAYTMRRITMSSSHVEHIKPEAICRNDKRGSDLDYRNLVACFPFEGMKNPYRYGAQEKNGWWDNEGKQFLSPLDPKCEVYFTFNLKGEIKVVGNNKPAETTIDLLRLNHNSLCDDRKRAIEEFIYGKSGTKPLNPKKTADAIDEICEDANGSFREFCIAIKHALKEHQNNLKKIIAKKKFSQASKAVGKKTK